MFVLITGTLHRDPIARTGKSGAPFVTAQMRYRAGPESGFASIIAFAEDVRAELLRLKEDDVISVQGEARLGTYTAKDGTTRPSLEITASHVLALRQPKPATATQNATCREQTWPRFFCNIAGMWKRHRAICRELVWTARSAHNASRFDCRSCSHHPQKQNPSRRPGDQGLRLASG